MVAILNTNTSISVPIVSVTSSNLAGGIYTQLTVNTQIAHGLSAGSMISIYSSSSDLVDGFYTVIAAPTTTSFTIPYISADQIGSTGGLVHGGAAAPAFCVLEINIIYRILSRCQRGVLINMFLRQPLRFRFPIGAGAWRRVRQEQSQKQ